MKTIILISPHFPQTYYRFAEALKHNGFRVLGIGDASWDELCPELKANLDEWYACYNMDNFDNESKRDAVLQKLLYDQRGMVSFKDLDNNMPQIVDRYKEIIEKNYYYVWFRHYLTHKNESLSEISNDNVPLINKHVEVLHTRKLLQYLLNPAIATINSFDKNAEIILEAFARIMDVLSAPPASRAIRRRSAAWASL